MLISVAVLTGFQKQITEKVIGFGGHIQITDFVPNASLEPKPVEKSKFKLPTLKNIKGVAHSQVLQLTEELLKPTKLLKG